MVNWFCYLRTKKSIVKNQEKMRIQFKLVLFVPLIFSLVPDPAMKPPDPLLHLVLVSLVPGPAMEPPDPLHG